MYYDHFGLNQPPFKITPDTALFYPGGSRGEILEAMIYAITSGEGMIKVIGEVGSGKTMLSRMLEVRLPETVEIVYLANPSVAPGDIVHAIAAEMGLQVDPGSNRLQVLHALQNRLLEKHAEGRQVVCFVEEAQSMPLETLEEIRLLSNLETQRNKLLQLVLFGQPELDRNLDQASIRQLRERIVHSFDLEPFTEEEVRGYVKFRMQASGYRGPEVFQRGAYRRIARASDGLIRRINILGDKALLAAYAESTHVVTPRHVDIAIKDSEFGRRYRRKLSLRAAAAGLAVVSLAVVWEVLHRVEPPWRSGADATLATPAPPAVVPVNPVPAPARPEPAPSPARAEPAATLARAEPAPSPARAEPAVALARAEPAAAPARAEPAVALVRAEPAPSPAPAPARAEPVPVVAPAEAAPAPTAPAPVADRVRDEPAPAGPRPLPEPRPAARPPFELANALTLSDRVAPGAAPRPVRASGAGDEGPGERTTGTPAGSGRPYQENVAIADGARFEPPAPRPRPAAREARQDPSPPARRSAPAPARQVVPAPGQHAVVPDPEPAGPRVLAAARTASPAPAAGARGGPVNGTGDGSAGGLLEARLDATRGWLETANGRHFSIQLMLTKEGKWQNLEDLLARWNRETGLADVYVYKTRIRGRTWLGVLYREYRTFQDAKDALERLPEELKRHKPFIRNIRDISVA